MVAFEKCFFFLHELSLYIHKSKCYKLKIRYLHAVQTCSLFISPVADEDILADIGAVTQISQPLSKYLNLLLPPTHLTCIYTCYIIIEDGMIITCHGQSDTGQPISEQSWPVPHPRPVQKKIILNFFSLAISHL